MPSFAAGNGQFTPSTTVGNWHLDAGTSPPTMGRVTQISWGGSGASSIGYRTRWTRPSTLGATASAGTLAYNNPNYASAGCAFNLSYTTAPLWTADPGNNLYATDWNVQGGSGILVLPLAQPWWIFALASGGANKQQLSCVNTKGLDASLSSYNVAWEED